MFVKLLVKLTSIFHNISYFHDISNYFNISKAFSRWAFVSMSLYDICEESFQCKRSVVDLRRQLVELRRWASCLHQNMGENRYEYTLILLDAMIFCMGWSDAIWLVGTLNGMATRQQPKPPLLVTIQWSDNAPLLLNYDLIYWYTENYWIHWNDEWVPSNDAGFVEIYSKETERGRLTV